MYRSFFDNFNIPILIINSDTFKVYDSNIKFCELIKLPKNNIIGFDINIFFPELNLSKIKSSNLFEIETIILVEKKVKLIAETKIKKIESEKVSYYEISVSNVREKFNLAIDKSGNFKKELNSGSLFYIGKIEFLHHLLNSLPVLIVAFDKDFVIRFWNKESERVMVYSSDELVNNKSIKILFPDEEIFDTVKQDLLNSNLVFRDKEWDLVTKKNHIKTISWSTLSKSNVLPNSYIWLVGNEVTERNKMAYLLIEEEKKYRNLFQMASDYMLTLDFNGHITDVNESVLKGFGYKREELINKPIEFIVAIESIPVLKSSIANLISGEDILQYEILARKKYSDTEWLEVKNRIILIDGKQVGIELIARDVTSRKLIQEALRLNQSFLNRLIDNLPVAVYVKDYQTWKYMLWNKTAEKIYNFSFIEVLDRTDFELFDKERAEFVRDLDIEVFSNNAPYNYIDEYYNQSDRKIHFLSKIKIPVFDEFGYPLHLMVITEDITERKLAEDALKQSEERYRLISENMRDMICLHERDGSFSYISPSVNEVLNYSSEELLNKSILEVIYSDDKEMVRDGFERIFNNEVNYNTIQYRVVKNGGIMTWVESTLQGIKGENDRIQKILCVSTDITEKVKSAEIRQKLQSELTRLSQVAKQTTSAVIITDINGKVVWVNDAFSKLTGYSLEEVKNRDPRELLQGPEIGQQISSFIRERIKSSFSLDLRTYNFTKTRKGFWTDLRVDPMFDTDGNHIGYISVENDITEKVEYEIQLRNAKEKAEESNRLKSHFLANMSHEIRTPMIGILGYADILREELPEPEMQEMAERIFVNGQRLMDTINLIIDLSRIETNKLEMDLRRINVFLVSGDVVNLFEKAARIKNLEIKLVCKNKDVFAFLDERMFRGILNNLVNNSVKFTEKGSVIIEIETFFEHDTKFKGGKKEFVKINVADTGIGIPKDKLKIIFDEFRQVSEGHNRKFEGTGLGLTISKRFTEIMKGNISCESEYGKGSKFFVSFPCYE